MDENTPQTPSERALEGLGPVEVLQWSGSNLEAVRAFLGPAFHAVRGGLADNDPLVVWIDLTVGPQDSPAQKAYDRAYPTDWIIRMPQGGGIEYLVRSDEDVDRDRRLYNWPPA